MYFANHSLYETAGRFCRNGGVYLFIDEVHKYPGWSRELKAIYDSYPDLHVRFTGSSVLDIRKGEADLSRRAPIYLMQGLSFREYLAMRHDIHVPVLSLDEIIAQGVRIPGVAHPLPLFADYLRCGYYPFGTDATFGITLGQVISLTMEVDIPQFAGMTAATGRKLKKLMVVVGGLVPFKPNLTSLAGQIQVSRNNVEDYLLYMERAGMIAQLRDGSGGLIELGKVVKVYLDNTNILYVLSNGHEDIGTVRETFFFNQMRVGNDVRASNIGDFRIGDAVFEVGGRSKGQEQVRAAERGFIVKDDIEYGHGNVIPLWAFGFNY